MNLYENLIYICKAQFDKANFFQHAFYSHNNFVVVVFFFLYKNDY